MRATGKNSLRAHAWYLSQSLQRSFAGYVTVVWESKYPPFLAAGIPEVVDFNVLLKFRRRGIGTLLMDAAEASIARHCRTAGIGVGLTADYGPAHVLYCKRGYLPDGLGLFQAGRHCKYGDRPVVNDDLTLSLPRNWRSRGDTGFLRAGRVKRLLRRPARGFG